MARFMADFISQKDGSECWNKNCWAAVGAELLAAATGGKKTRTPTQFRRLARVADCLPGGLSDMMRGLMNADAWTRCKYLVDVPKEDIRKMLLRRNGAVVAFETDFEDWPEGTVCQPSFNDREDAYHSISVICGQGKYKQRGKVLVQNPLCDKYRWVDVDVIIEAVMTYNREHFETQGTADCIVVLPPMA